MSAGRKPGAAARGFTLVELVVVMALIAIMLAIAAPNFVTFQRNSQLTSTANSFIAAMSAARAEAMKSNSNTYLVPNTTSNNPSSTCTAGWTCGWFVYVDANKNGTWDSATERQLVVQGPVPSIISTPANTNVTQFSDGTSQYVLYNGSGFPRLQSGGFQLQSLDFAYGTATDGSTTRRILSSATGRMWVCTPTAANALACSPTDNS